MSGFLPRNILHQPKRRSFIYNLGPQAAPTSSGLRAKSEDCGHSKASPQPRKKHKSFHAEQVRSRAVEELAVAEVCRDLPLDAFDDDLECGIEDDDELDDSDLLTAANQLDEFERVASLDLSPSDHVPNVENPVRSFAQVDSSNVPQPTSNPPESRISGLAQGRHTPHGRLCSSKPNPNLSVDKRESRISTPLQKTITSAERDTKYSSLTDRSGFLNETAPNLFSDRSEWSAVGSCGKSPLDIQARDLPHDDEVQALKKRLEDLTRQCTVAENRVQSLEEQTLGREGEIKLLRDSLDHFRAQEMKREKEKRESELRCTREQSEREKDLERQMESLKTRLQFTEREMNQIIEQNKKLMAGSGTDKATPSPVKKGSKLGEGFPSGNSFLQRTSPQLTKISKRPQSPFSKRLEYSEDSCTSSLQATPSAKVVTDRDSLKEKGLVQLHHSECLEVQLAHKLFAFQDVNSNAFCWTYDVASTDNGFCSAARVNSWLLQNLQCGQNALNTACGGVSQMSSTLQQPLSKVWTGERERSQALGGLYKLLNEHSHMDGSGSHQRGIALTDSNSCLEMAEDFLPLLESHIAAFIEERTRVNTGDTSDEDASSRTQSRYSPTPDASLQREKMLSEAEQLEKLALLCNNAINSLCLLNVLVLYSQRVRDILLECCGKNANETLSQEATQLVIEDADGEIFQKHPSFPGLLGVNVLIKCGDNSQVNQVGLSKPKPSHQQGVQVPCELMSCLAKLLCHHPNEPQSLTQAVLQVMLSLVQNCSPERLSRLLFLFSDGLLSQSVSKEPSLTTLSLVASILSSMAPCVGILPKLCSQTEDCLLMKLYRGLVFVPGNVPMTHVKMLHQQVITLLNNLWSNQTSALAFLLETECQCNLELIKCLLLMLSREVKTINSLPVETLNQTADSRSSLSLLRTGMFLLIALCTHNRLHGEQRTEAEHEYVSLLNSVTGLYKRIRAHISDAEVVALQDLLYIERIDHLDWAQDSDDECDVTGLMEVDG